MVVAAAVVVAVTGSSEPWERMQRVQSPPSVWTAATRSGAWLYGDSITVGTITQTARLVYAQTGEQTAVDANSGIPTAPALDRLTDRARQRGAPKVLVMATGANDAVDPARAAVMSAEVNRARQIVGPGTRVVWVTSWPSRRGSIVNDRLGSQTVNAAIRGAASDRTVDLVIPWDQTVLKHGAGAVTRDGVHPNPTGAALYSELITNTLVCCIPR